MLISAHLVVQVLGLGTDTGETVASVLLFFDRQRYVFNAGEGFQRFTVEHKIKLNRLSRILVSRLTSDATGGLPGSQLAKDFDLKLTEPWIIECALRFTCSPFTEIQS